MQYDYKRQAILLANFYKISNRTQRQTFKITIHK